MRTDPAAQASDLAGAGRLVGGRLATMAGNGSDRRREGTARPSRDADGSKDTGSHTMDLSTIPDAPGSADAGPAPGCALVAPGTGATPWLRTELFFGCAKPDGTAVSAAEWETFLDAEITPRFPEGLTVLEAAGQWQEADGDIVEERSKVVLLLYPHAARRRATPRSRRSAPPTSGGSGRSRCYGPTTRGRSALRLGATRGELTLGCPRSDSAPSACSWRGHPRSDWERDSSGYRRRSRDLLGLCCGASIISAKGSRSVIAPGCVGRSLILDACPMRRVSRPGWPRPCPASRVARGWWPRRSTPDYAE